MERPLIRNTAAALSRAQKLSFCFSGLTTVRVLSLLSDKSHNMSDCHVVITSDTRRVSPKFSTLKYYVFAKFNNSFGIATSCQTDNCCSEVPKSFIGSSV